MTPLEVLRLRRQQADTYASAHGIDPIAMTVAWLVVSEGVPFARQICRKCNRRRPLRICYQNLLDSGLIIEGPPAGLVYNENPIWEKGNGPLRWLEEFAKVAAGQERHPLL